MSKSPELTLDMLMTVYCLGLLDKQTETDENSNCLMKKISNYLYVNETENEYENEKLWGYFKILKGKFSIFLI